MCSKAHVDDCLPQPRRCEFLTREDPDRTHADIVSAAEALDAGPRDPRQSRVRRAPRRTECAILVPSSSADRQFGAASACRCACPGRSFLQVTTDFQRSEPSSNFRTDPHFLRNSAPAPSTEKLVRSASRCSR